MCGVENEWCVSDMLIDYDCVCEKRPHTCKVGAKVIVRLGPKWVASRPGGEQGCGYYDSVIDTSVAIRVP